MNRRTKQNLKGLAEIVGILAFIIGGSLVIVEGISKFDRWHMNYIEKKEMKEYRKNYPVQKQNYQLNYLEERR